MLSLAGCNTLPTERQLIGTWTAPERITLNESGIEQSHSKQIVALTLRPDHTFVWTSRGKRRKDFGRWYLSGRYLVSEFNNPGRDRKTHYPYRDKIIKLTSQELIYVQGEDAPGETVHLTKR